MQNRHRYSLEQLAEMMEGDAESFSPVLIELKQCSGYCKMPEETTSHTLAADVSRQTQVNGNSCPVYKADNEENQTAIKKFIKQHLALPNESEQTLERVFNEVNKYYNQSVGGAFKAAIVNPFANAMSATTVSITPGSIHSVYSQRGLYQLPNQDEFINIYRDTFTGTVYVESIFTKIKVKTFDGKHEVIIPGSFRSRFKLTREDIEQDKGFCLDYFEASNSLLEELCLKNEFDMTTLTQRIQQAQQEEQYNYEHSIADLELTLKSTTCHPDVKKCGYTAIEQVRKLEAENTTDLSTLTHLIHSTNDVIKEPNKHFDGYRQLANKMPTKRSWGKILSGVALALLGAVIVAASVAVAVASFGVATPLSAMGIVIGASVVTAGVACAAGVVGLGAMTAGSILFFKGCPSQPKQTMYDLAEAVKPQLIAR